MSYFVLRAASIVKRGIGLLTTVLVSWHNKLNNFIRSRFDKEVTKIKVNRDTRVAAAKKDVVYVASRVMELEQRVSEVQQEAEEKANQQIFKLTKKVH